LQPRSSTREHPDFYGDDRAGDNLYTGALLAIDADTGAIRWHYQFTPHDVHDWDSAHVPVLAEQVLFFVTAHETCAVWEPRKPTPPIKMGARVPSGGRTLVAGREQHAALRAIDAATGQIRWEHAYRPYPSNVSFDLCGGILTTAAGLLFTGDNDGWFYAFDSATGKQLWRYQTGAPIWGSAPITYQLDGRQWVVTTSGLSLMAFALPRS
jgi:glucose dehydrogenase